MIREYNLRIWRMKSSELRKIICSTVYATEGIEGSTMEGQHHLGGLAVNYRWNVE